MKFNAKTLCLLVVMSMAAKLWISEQVWAQNPSPNPKTETIGKAIESMQQIQGAQQPGLRPTSPYELDPFYAGLRNTPTRDSSGAIRKAAEAVRDAKGEDAKSAAQKKLGDLLSKSYDEDMARRERELKQIEERLTKLRELLSRRRSKKQEIIDLQTKVALNEADGLGFYENERLPKTGFGTYYYSPGPTVPPVLAIPPTPYPSDALVVPKATAESTIYPGDVLVVPKATAESTIIEAPPTPAPPETPGPPHSKDFPR
jgi:hypothetical protein